MRTAIFWYVAGVLTCGAISCIKADVSTHEARLKAPVRIYNVTSRIDKKEANNDSKATGVLRGRYDERSKVFKYKLDFEGLDPKTVMFREGPRGKTGKLLWVVPANKNKEYKTPLTGEKVLTALEERNLLKGAWFVTIDSELRSPEIRGIITLKLAAGG